MGDLGGPRNVPETEEKDPEPNPSLFDTGLRQGKLSCPQGY